MTNNPTIDGVSRELIERFPSLGVDDYQGWANEVYETLLAAPVVERQDDDALSKGFYTTQSGGGNYAINIGFRTLSEMQAADKQMLDLLRSRTAPPQLAELQAEIELLKSEQDLMKSVVEVTAKAVGDSTGLMWMKIQTAFLRDIPSMQATIEQQVAVLEKARYRLETYIEADREMTVPSIEVLIEAIKGLDSSARSAHSPAPDGCETHPHNDGLEDYREGKK